MTGGTPDPALRGPDFFLVGAPKCGTTAMDDFFRGHPQVGMCPWKETHQFAGPLYWSRFGPFHGDHPSEPTDYLGYFRGVQDRLRIGESSVWYLHSPTAAEDIYAFDPAADIIVMLRNPIEMLPSLHAQLVYMGIEPETDFERALALDPVRAEHGGPKGFPPDSYADAARFAPQLRRYLERFPREQVHIVLYDDFKVDPLGSYRSVCAALGIDPDVELEAGVVNPRRRVRSHTLNRLLVKAPTPMRRTWVGTRLQAWNTPVAPHSDLAPTVARTLLPLVAEQVEQLGGLLSVDLASWLTAAESAASDTI